MQFDPKRTFEALKNYNEYIPPENIDKNEIMLLRKKKDKETGVYFLEFVSKKKMRIGQKFLAFFGLSDFNLKKVLSVFNEIASPKSSISQDRKTLLEAFKAKIQKKVEDHYKGKIPKRVDKRLTLFTTIVSKVEVEGPHVFAQFAKKNIEQKKEDKFVLEFPPEENEELKKMAELKQAVYDKWPIRQRDANIKAPTKNEVDVIPIQGDAKSLETTSIGLQIKYIRKMLIDGLNNEEIRPLFQEMMKMEIGDVAQASENTKLETIGRLITNCMMKIVEPLFPESKGLLVPFEERLLRDTSVRKECLAAIYPQDAKPVGSVPSDGKKQLKTQFQKLGKELAQVWVKDVNKGKESLPPPSTVEEFKTLMIQGLKNEAVRSILNEMIKSRSETNPTDAVITLIVENRETILENCFPKTNLDGSFIDEMKKQSNFEDESYLLLLKDAWTSTEKAATPVLDKSEIQAEAKQNEIKSQLKTMGTEWVALFKKNKILRDTPNPDYVNAIGVIQQGFGKKEIREKFIDMISLQLLIGDSTQSEEQQKLDAIGNLLTSNIKSFVEECFPKVNNVNNLISSLVDSFKDNAKIKEVKDVLEPKEKEEIIDEEDIEDEEGIEDVNNIGSDSIENIEDDVVTDEDNDVDTDDDDLSIGKATGPVVDEKGDEEGEKVKKKIALTVNLAIDQKVENVPDEEIKKLIGVIVNSAQGKQEADPMKTYINGLYKRDMEKEFGDGKNYLGFNVKNMFEQKIEARIAATLSNEQLAGLVNKRVTACLSSFFTAEDKKVADIYKYFRDYFTYEARTRGKMPDRVNVSARTIFSIMFIMANMSSGKDVFEWGQAIDQGDCFYDAFAKGINAVTDKTVDVKTLRSAIQSYTQSSNDEAWEKEIMKGAAGGGYLTIEEYCKNVGPLLSETESGGPWGRENYEGKLLSKLYNVRLHVFKAMPLRTMPVHLPEFIRDRTAQERKELFDLLKDIPEGLRTNALVAYQKANIVMQTEKLQWPVFFEKFKKCIEGQKNQSVLIVKRSDIFEKSTNADAIFKKELTKQENEEIRSINLEITALAKQKDAMTVVNELIDNPKQLIDNKEELFAKPEWEIISDAQGPNPKDIYIALYPGHFFPLFKKK